MALLNDCKVTDKNLERKLEKKVLSRNALLSEFRWAENEIGKVWTEINFLKGLNEEIIANDRSEMKVYSKS